MQQLIELYYHHFNTKPQKIEAISQAGSSRQYYHLGEGEKKSVGCVGTSQQENHAFIELTRHFCKQHLPVPEILAVSADEMRYLQTDLGSTSLYDALSEGRVKSQYSESEVQLLHKTIALLPHMQIIGAEGLDTSLCYPTPRMDKTSIMFDLNYFKYCFLKLIPNLDFNEICLEKDFQQLSLDIDKMSMSSNSIILRDCQARNVMLYGEGEDSKPYFIDYQGCRIGPKEYDLASFLWQSSAKYPDSLRQSLIETYIESLQDIQPTTSPDSIYSNLELMLLFRLLQVLGAYGFRGLIEHKAYFLNSIPLAIQNLKDLLKSDVCTPYPYLKNILQKIINYYMPETEEGAYGLDKINASNKDKICVEDKIDSQLTVTVWSFSYKRGIPADDSGNGGGYVFDCRSTHNPGKYQQYKNLTGLDKPVIEFLENDGEIISFLNNVYPMVENHTRRFVGRGFTHLMVCFGCTGGQHRSVYSAQHVAEYLRKKFPQIKIHLIHREQKINTYL